MTTLLLSAILVCSPSRAEPATHETTFGSDVSVGYAFSRVVGEGLSSRSHGSALFRLDTFIHDRSYEGPQLGLGVWGQMSVSPKPTILSVGDQIGGQGAEQEVPIDFNHAGIAVIFRQQPEAPIAATFGFGFGRLEMSTETEGRVALPAFTIEAGGRYKTTRNSFIDLMARAHWATRHSAITQKTEEWWFLELATLVGGHLR
jgi:hypothetical protein